MYGHVPYGIVAFQIFHVAVVGGGLYLLYSISKLLQRIADNLDKANRD